MICSFPVMSALHLPTSLASFYSHLRYWLIDHVFQVIIKLNMLKCVFLTFIKQRQQQRALVYETPKTHSSSSNFQVLIQHEPLSHLDQVKQGWLHELPDAGQRLQEELGLQLQVQTLGRGKTGEKSDRTAETRSSQLAS